MNEVEAGRMLAVIATIDPKMPEPDDQDFMVNLWSRMLHDVPADAAEKAVETYYRSERYLTHREVISPADIVQWWNARRRPSESERHGGWSRPEFNPAAIHAGIDRAVAALAARKAIDAGEDPGDAADAAEGEAAMRRLVLGVKCPWLSCRGTAGQPCTTAKGGPLTKTVYHPSRIEFAEHAQSGCERPEVTHRDGGMACVGCGARFGQHVVARDHAEATAAGAS